MIKIKSQRQFNELIKDTNIIDKDLFLECDIKADKDLVIKSCLTGYNNCTFTGETIILQGGKIQITMLIDHIHIDGGTVNGNQLTVEQFLSLN